MRVKTTGFEVNGNMPGESVNMSLSGDSLEHIMDILSDLYSNRPAAIIREYTTNALDAHIISGQTKPVEISTPNRLDPNLVIKDFGPGMSKETLINTYSKYGASTKRNNDLEAGQLGLGSKSGFAYTDQFTVRSVNDGYACELIMSRNDRGAAEMTIAMEHETDEPSGVTITIPIKSTDVDTVIGEANRFASYATPGTILLDGKLNELDPNWEKVTDKVYAHATVGAKHKIVMGNVAYEANLFPDTWVGYKGYVFVVHVNMGEVDFTPNREQLKYTAHTNRTLRKIEDYIADSLSKSIERDVGPNATRAQILKAYATMNRWRKYADITLPNGVSLKELNAGTEHISASLPFDINDSRDKIENYNSLQKKTDDRPRLTLSLLEANVDNTMHIVSGFDGVRLTREQARKIIHADPDFAGKMVYLMNGEESEFSDLIENRKVLNWSEVKQIKLAPTPQRKKKVDKAGDQYRGYMVHKRDCGVEKMLKISGPVYYVSRQELNQIPERRFPREDFKLIFVQPAKTEAFLKKNPNAKSLVAYCNNRQRQIQRHMQTEYIAKALAWAMPDRYTKWMDLGKITNKDFADKIKLARTGAKWLGISGLYCGRSMEFHNFIQDNYPLADIDTYFRAHRAQEHAIQYINMIGENNVNA